MSTTGTIKLKIRRQDDRAETKTLQGRYEDTWQPHERDQRADGIAPSFTARRTEKGILPPVWDASC
jgi:hypothetical protein